MSESSFNVIVHDSTPPAFTSTQTNVTAEATSAAGSVVTFTAPTAHDAVSGDLTATCSQASGSTFVLGTTVVHCTVSDAAGNTTTSSFDVHVADSTPPTFT